MGTCLYGAIQQYRPKDAIYRESWDTIAIFEFNKDYQLSMALEVAKGHTHTLDWFPVESKDMHRYQNFLPIELPRCDSSPRFQSFKAALGVFDSKAIRCIFWRDQ